MVEELTPAQREEVVKEYEEIKKQEWEKKYKWISRKQVTQKTCRRRIS